MTQNEMVTSFSLKDDSKIGDLIKALNAHLRAMVGEFQESCFCDATAWDEGGSKHKVQPLDSEEMPF